MRNVHEMSILYKFRIAMPYIYTFAYSYYMNGRTSNVKDLINPDHFGFYEREIQQCQDIIKSTSHPHLPVWNGETADAYDSGIPNVTDRFASGFL